MVRTWIADVTPLLQEEIYQKYYDRVPEVRQEKADRLRKAEDKALSVGAWILLMRMRERYGLGDGSIYNLSHSGRYAVCTIDDSDRTEFIGCDVEMTGTYRKNVAERFYCPDEFRYISMQDGDEAQTEAFFRLWVLKESFMKAVRMGMKLSMKTYEFDFSAGVPRLVRKPESISGDFYFKEYSPEGKDAKVAVCASRDDFALELQMDDL